MGGVRPLLLERLMAKKERWWLPFLFILGFLGIIGLIILMRGG
jgi:hypothetical protein